MGVFADRMMLQFTEDLFVKDWLTTQVRTERLFNVVYNTAWRIEIKPLTIGNIHCEFELPAFETLRMHRTDERIVPTTERTRIEGTWPRRGRLEWVDVFLNVSLHGQVALLEAPLERITAIGLEQKLGGFASLDDLKNKLAGIYGPSVVTAFFQRIPVASIEDFRKLSPQFLEFESKPLAPFDPGDPASSRTFPLNVCVLIRETLAFREALQLAKLCRSILENEEDHVDSVGGADVITPYAFVVIFPTVGLTDQTIPGETVETVKTKVASLFQSENMLSLFA